ncbi:hypothetical protein [Algoriphagus sp.]|uniref:tetratricopeptide repeat protein n=1 Tax=Algoriphagus sp. TaxID=1872435 RepID=UPI0026375464|nr:hypothetical protein [Algoriphagus sp.]
MVHRIVFTLLLFFAGLFLVQAQYSRLLHKPHWEQTESLSDLYDLVVEFKMDRSVFEDTLANMRELARREGDQVMQTEADFLELSYELLVEKQNLEGMIKFQREQEKKEQLFFACRAAEAISKYYWYAQENEKMLNWHLHLEELLNKVSVEEFPEKALYLQGIGSDYRYFGDLEKAISYFKLVASYSVPEVYINAWRHALNNMGFTYRQMGLLDSADHVFNQLLLHSKETSEQWYGIASGNVGYNHYLKGNFEASIPFLKTDIRLALKYNDLGLAAQSSIPLADIYIEKERLDTAKYLIDQALDYIQTTGQTDRLRNLYPVMSKWESSMNHPERATAYMDSALVATKAYNEKFSALQLMRANQLVTANQRQAEIQRLNAESDRNKMIRNFIIGGLFFLLVGSVLVYQLKQERIKSAQKLKDLELEQVHSDLENAQRLLKIHVERINNNSRIIRSLEDSEPTAEQKQVLFDLRESTILTESDWTSFQAQFTTVFPGLIESLTQQYPTLTPAEIRYLLLLRLELSKHEIANALGVSPDSLRVTWFRIRKKLDLPKDLQAPLFFQMALSEQ